MENIFASNRYCPCSKVSRRGYCRSGSQAERTDRHGGRDAETEGRFVAAGCRPAPAARRYLWRSAGGGAQRRLNTWRETTLDEASGPRLWRLARHDGGGFRPAHRRAPLRTRDRPRHLYREGRLPPEGAASARGEPAAGSYTVAPWTGTCRDGRLP